jgi:hypothetical protein
VQPARARDSGGLIIEDDYDGEFRFDREPIGAMQGRAPDDVVYVGTASKSLAPGLRLAWAVVAPRFLEAFLGFAALWVKWPSPLYQVLAVKLARAAGAVEPRTTNSGSNSSLSAAATVPSIWLASSFTAARPIDSMGWRMVVSGGSVHIISVESS